MRGRVLLVAGLFGGLLVACGGAPKAQKSRSAAPPSTQPTSRPAAEPTGKGTAQPYPAKLTFSEPCASRLHDICGLLLLYMDRNIQLPGSLDDLRALPGAQALAGDFTCPVSGKPYVYNPTGVSGPNISMRAVIYDPEPTHGAFRRAIVVHEAKPGAAFRADVVSWPETRFPKAVLSPSPVR